MTQKSAIQTHKREYNINELSQNSLKQAFGEDGTGHPTNSKKMK